LVKGIEAVTRTFRLSSTLIKVLEEEAQQEGISASALLNRILQRYSESTRWGDKHNALYLSNSSFSKLIESMTEEEAFTLGKESAPLQKDNIVFFMWKGKTLEDFIQWMDRNYGIYSGWFRAFHKSNGNKHILVVTHKFSQKWSYYLAGYIPALFDSIQGIALNYKISGNSISFTFEN